MCISPFTRIRLPRFRPKNRSNNSARTISRFTMSSRRYFPNPFSDYSIEQNLSLQSAEWNTKCATIKTHAVRLFRHWEANRIDSNDISAYTGITGDIMLYFKMYKSGILPSQSDSADCLAKCLSLIERAIGRIKSSRIRVPTFMCGEIGPLAVAAVIHHRLGRETYRDYIRMIASIHGSVCDVNTELPDEILYGRSGYLYALLLIRSTIAESVDTITDRMIRAVVDAIIESGRRSAAAAANPRSNTLVYTWYNEPYVGAAHGYAGIEYMLLEAQRFLPLDETLTIHIRSLVQSVVGLQFGSGNFPACLGETDDRLVHWCHGSPGVLHMLLLAYQLHSNDADRLLPAITLAADDIWRRGLLKKGYGLCHGASGNAYAFVRAFQVTRQPIYLHRAIAFAEWCCEYGTHGCRTPDTPYSMFEGLAGTVFFLLDMLQPMDAKFPAFQLST